jgi:ribosomal protein S18 acetylase RimI-like enzyme
MEPRPVAPLFGNWPYDPTTALLTLRSGHHPEATITSDMVKMWLGTAQHGGFARVRTNAVSPQLADILATVGFTVKQELSLLTAPLQEVPSHAQTVSARRVTAAQAIRIDCAAFHGEWAIDPPALLSAKQATQFHRLRGLGSSPMRRTTSYCLSGFTPSSAESQYGYIQRLAVHPSAQRNGYGRKLVLDAMHWLGSRGMQHALVNTDSTNEAALSLYHSLGFAPMTYSLYVLERACTD